MSVPIHVAIHHAEFFMRNVRVRIPFRYGNACLQGSPILHCRLTLQDRSGNRAIGVSADALPPRWFDKDSAKPYRQNVADLLAAVDLAAKAYLDYGSSPQIPFTLWREAYDRTRRAVMGSGLNALIASFGSSILERAMLDGAGKLAGRDFHTMLRDGHLGLEPQAIHPELAGASVATAIGNAPAASIAVRHTLGLSDPIYEADVQTVDRVNDGLPESLEAWLEIVPLRFFKIKLSGIVDQDAERLCRLFALLNAKARGEVRLSFDGNENFTSPQMLAEWLETIGRDNRLRQLMARVMYIEQPLDRAHALSAEGAASFAGFANLPPLIIDESDDHLDAFVRAAALGYRGTSVKSCKGVFKGVLNRMLADHYNANRGGGYLLTGEDLTTIPSAPLQQDLCVMSVLRLDHLERNGQHYYRGLDHLSRKETEACIHHHSTLYEPWGRSARLRMQDGRLHLDSLRVPGLGMGFEPDWDSMTPLDTWTFDSMGLDED